jgi:hypothetical protein
MDVKASFYSKRQLNTSKYFSMNGDLVYCTVICALMNEQRLKVSLKAVLLQHGKRQPPITLSHAGNMKEIYANIQGLLNKIC